MDAFMLTSPLTSKTYCTSEVCDSIHIQMNISPTKLFNNKNKEKKKQTFNSIHFFNPTESGISKPSRRSCGADSVQFSELNCV